MEELFTQSVPVTITRGDREERLKSVCLTILLNNITNPVHKKEMIVRLTEETDPFFLYTLTISEEDFQSLKTQQGLLVDFASFPQKLIDLIELCLAESSKDIPKFTLQFQLPSSTNGGQPYIQVIETNPFRRLTHLALKLVPASDSYLKKYLAQTILSLKEQNEDLCQRLQHSESSLSAQLLQAEELLSTRTKELDRMKSDWSAEITSLKNDHDAEMNKEKEKAMTTQQELQRKLDTIKKEQELFHMKRIENLEDRIKELDTTNKELMDHKYRSEAAIRELKAKLKATEEELANTRQDLNRVRKENVSLESEVHAKEKSIGQLETRVAVLEQELKDKIQINDRTSELLKKSDDQKSTCEKQLEQKQRKVTQLESAFRQASEEIRKGNEIISKLQSDIKGLRLKLKSRNIATTQQEKLINEKDVEISKLKFELESLRNDLDKKKNESDASRGKIEQLETTVQQLREEIKTSENMAGWLNKQLNDKMIERGRVPIPPISRIPSEPLSAIRSSSYSASAPYKPQYSSTPTTGPGAGTNITRPSVHQFSTTGSSAGSNVTGPYTPPNTKEDGQQQKVLFRGVPSKPSPLSTHGLSSNRIATPTSSTNNEPFIDPKYLPPDLPPPPGSGTALKENVPSNYPPK